jgi:hypothetical protein
MVVCNIIPGAKVQECNMTPNKTVTTYAELDQWVSAFMQKDGLRLLFVVGNPGVSKSESFKRKMVEGQHRHIRTGRLTAFQLYKQIFKERGSAIILDDVDDALKKNDTARMLMSLCETDQSARRIAWYGSDSQLWVTKGKKKHRVPQEFSTTSRICIICNEWDILTKKLGALLDRGTVVFFDPDPAEIHRYVRQWFQDEEVYRFIGKHLDKIPQHSIRLYVQAAEQKRMGLDWKNVLLETWTNEQPTGKVKERLVRELLDDDQYRTEKDRIDAFVNHRDGGSRRTYFNIKKRLLA